MSRTKASSLSLFLSTLFVLAAAGPGMTQPGKTSTMPELGQAFLGEWVGTGTTPDGESFTSSLSFRWILDDNFLEVTNHVQNQNRKRHHFASTTYAWQPVLGKLVFWSFDRDGTINEGIAELDGQELRHEWRSFSKGGEILDWRSVLTKQDDSHATFRVIDSHGVELVAIKYRRESQ